MEGETAQAIWYPGDTVSAGIGQGYNLVTPLQLAFATATLVNDGVAFQSHLVKEIRRSRGEPLFTEHKQLFDLEIPPEHIKLVKDAMEAVTKPGGTAAGAAYGVTYRMPGKTGTAQVIAIKQGEKYDGKKVSEYNRDHAWFIAFAPVHMIAATSADLERVKDMNIPIVLCPRSYLFFRLKHNLELMKNTGVSLLFRTDNAMINSPDVLEEVRLLHKTGIFSLEELFAAVTYTPRKALNLDDCIQGRVLSEKVIVLEGDSLKQLYVSP